MTSEEERQSFAQEFLQIVIQGIEKNCFNACVTKPGEKLTAKEKMCLAKCQNRFLAAWEVVSQTIGHIKELPKNGEDNEN